MKWRFRVAESFSSSIQDDVHDSNLETLQTNQILNCKRQSDLIAKMATMAQSNIS